ncbi:hypothetical protein DFJ73DRAFT_760400 [Zopfochytrium polystomum]|nr:hypothetical protein DFJ73DRAFT_760400 [Zopfochytrium polystomum]
MAAAAAAAAIQPVFLLIVGLGWTGAYVRELAQQRQPPYPGGVAATTTTGRDGTIPFVYDPDAPAAERARAFAALPAARAAVLITFPLRDAAAASRFVDDYLDTHNDHPPPRFVLLGSTGAYEPDPAGGSPWCDHASPPLPSPRVAAEAALLAHPRLVGGGSGVDGRVGRTGPVVLSLSGLYDGASRHPSRFLGRVAPSKAALGGKRSVHYIHGRDVARAVLAVAEAALPTPQAGAGMEPPRPERWILTDLRVYDWWELASRLGGGGGGGGAAPPYATWVRELMDETGTRAVPRPPEALGRALDSRAFWREYGLVPVHFEL